MATTIAFAGELAEDPRVRFTPDGEALTSFRVVVSEAAGPGEGASTIHHYCQAWGDTAENVAESFSRGDRVTIQGEVRAGTWAADDGESRPVQVVHVAEIGASVRWATVRVRRLPQGGADGSGG